MSFEFTTASNQLLVDSGSGNKKKSAKALKELAVALETPIRKGIMNGDILFWNFRAYQIGSGCNS